MSATAKLFMHGRSQAVRLPKEFRFEGTEVKVGDKVILEPMPRQPLDLDKFWAELDALGARDFLPDGIPDDPPASAGSTRVLRRLICPDTNIVIGIVSGRSSVLRHRLGEQIRSGMQIALPVVALFEMRYGIAKGNRRVENEHLLDRFLGLGINVLPFETEDAAHAANIRADLEKAGPPIGPFDYLIAAQARRRSAALVTQNTREFARVPGLLLVDWVA